LLRDRALCPGDAPETCTSSSSTTTEDDACRVSRSQETHNQKLRGAAGARAFVLSRPNQGIVPVARRSGGNKQTEHWIAQLIGAQQQKKAEQEPVHGCGDLGQPAAPLERCFHRRHRAQ